MAYPFDDILFKCCHNSGNLSAGENTNMNVQATYLPLCFDRIKFTMQSKYGGFIVAEELYEGQRLVSSKELGIVYSSHHEGTRAIDSLVHLSRLSNPDKTIEWTN